MVEEAPRYVLGDRVVWRGGRYRVMSHAYRPDMPGAPWRYLLVDHAIPEAAACFEPATEDEMAPDGDVW